MRSLNEFLHIRWCHRPPYLPEPMLDDIEEWIRALLKIELHKAKLKK